MRQWNPIFSALAIGAFVTWAAITTDAAGGDGKQTGAVRIEDPWARPSAGMTGAGAVYMTLTNIGDEADTLTAAAAPVARKVELHTHIADGDVMRMRPIESIVVPAGATVQLRPGELHVMLVGLEKPLMPDQSFPLTLTFETGGEVTVNVPVLEMGATGPESHDRRGTEESSSGPSHSHGR